MQLHTLVQFWDWFGQLLLFQTRLKYSLFFQYFVYQIYPWTLKCSAFDTLHQNTICYHEFVSIFNDDYLNQNLRYDCLDQCFSSKLFTSILYIIIIWINILHHCYVDHYFESWLFESLNNLLWIEYSTCSMADIFM